MFYFENVFGYVCEKVWKVGFFKGVEWVGYFDYLVVVVYVVEVVGFG